METLVQMGRPSTQEQRSASISSSTLAAILKQIHTEETEIEIEGSSDKIRIPSRVLALLGEVLKAMSQGLPISIVPLATELTTQKASEILGCSRPHFIKLLEKGDIAYTKVGKHRRVKFEDVVLYQSQMKATQKQHLIDIMHFDEDLGLYDS